jgi:hypothetical protein
LTQARFDFLTAKIKTSARRLRMINKSRAPKAPFKKGAFGG